MIMNPNRSLARLVHLIPVTLGILALLACFGIWALPASAQSPSFVRIIHASPDVGTADVFLDGSKLLSSFQFGAITDYASIPAGPHKVQIALVGKGINAAAITETLTVSPGTAYTVAAIGTNATGLPGLPGTGSDPRPLSTSSQPLAPWLLAALAMLLIGTSLFARRLAHNH